MFARIIDSQGQVVAVVDWQIVTLGNGQILDRFIDTNGNVYLERSHDDSIDGIELMNYLRIGAHKFYQMQGLGIHIGRTN